MNYSEILTLVLVLITAFYAWSTYQILKTNERTVEAIREQSKELNRLEAYDRRLKVYDAITRFVAEIKLFGTTNNEKLIDLLRETKHAKFLFGKDDDIKEYIDLLYQKGLNLEYKEKEIWSESRVCGNEQKEKLIEESRALKDWFTAQFDTVDVKFRKHLQL